MTQRKYPKPDPVPGAQFLTHPFEPFHDTESTRLILGTFPSPKSREFGFYYGHPRNRFWTVLSAVFGLPLPGTIKEKKALCRSAGIALWDVVGACRIVGASDQSISAPQVNPIETLIQGSKIQTVFTTGTKAYALYTKYCEMRTGFPATRLPSPSPANCAIPLETLIERYRALLLGSEPSRARPRFSAGFGRKPGN